MPINTPNYGATQGYGITTTGTLNNTVAGGFTGALTAGASAYGNISMTIAPPARPTLTIEHLDDGLSFTFTSEENGKLIELALAPERDITAYEQLLLSNMILAIAIGPALPPVMFMRFVRKHNLERHFKIAAV
jgi:hypothetical protein